MDYFSVIILIVVTFVFISDRNIKSLEKIKSEDMNILYKVKQIRENLDIVKTKNINYKNILDNLKASDKDYILLHNNKIQLDEYKTQTLIANYITCSQRPCGFNLLYIYHERQQLRRIYLEIINYLNIFNKKEFSTYGIIICKKTDLKQNEQEIKNKIISYTPSEITHIKLKKEEIRTEQLKNIYLNKIRNSKLSVVLKILLLIISGSIITTNLIYSLLNINNNNINGFIVSLVIYYCYSYIIRYIYKPIGKQRVVASYIFPIYFILYVFVGLTDWGARVIKKVHAS